MADVQKSVEILFQGKDQASEVANKIAIGLERTRDAAGATTPKLNETNRALEEISQTSNSVDAALSKVESGFKALAAGLIVDRFIEVNKTFESYVQTMKFVTGSNESAATSFEFVRGLADRLGVSVTQAATSYAKFAAATKGSAIEGQAAQFVYESFAKAIVATGGNTNDLAGAMVQLSQGVSKGRFELEDLKSIAERVPGFFNLFSESLGISTAELFKLISAGGIGTEELLKFSGTLNKAFQDVEIKSFEAAVSRLKNSLDELFIAAGTSGAFDALKKGVDGAAASVAGVAALVKLVGETLGNVAFSLEKEDYGIFSRGFRDRFTKSMDDAADSTRKFRDRLLGVTEAAASAGAEVTSGIDKVPQAAKGAEKATNDLSASLKGLGIDPKTVTDGLDKIYQSFINLANNENVTGSQWLSGFLVALDKVNKTDLPELTRYLGEAFQRGTLSADEYAAAVNALDAKQSGLFDTMVRTTKATQDQEKAFKEAEKEAKRAEERAKQYALELEKLASNERIKKIDVVFQLNAKQIESDLQKVKASFDAVSKGIESTAAVINTALGALSGVGGFYGLEKLKLIEEQLSKENEFRREQFDLQKELVREQINRLKAQTEAITKGDALIRIDGSGLAPQLEAFMWEILRAIQVRVNRDGLPLLLGA